MRFEGRATGSLASLTLVLGILAGACTTPTAANPDVLTPDANGNCDGLAQTVGGCRADRPVFAGTECATLAVEWGRDVDHRLLGIAGGPKDVEGEARSVRAYDALVLASTAVALRLGNLGLLGSCDLEEFLPIAEGKFSAELRQQVGGIAFDGDPVVSYEQWRDEIVKVIRVIDPTE